MRQANQSTKAKTKPNTTVGLANQPNIMEKLPNMPGASKEQMIPVTLERKNRDIKFVKGSDLKMEEKFSLNESRRREGLAPYTRPSEHQLDPLYWFNWRSSNPAVRRRPNFQYKCNMLVVKFAILDREKFKKLSDLLQLEVYMVFIILLKSRIHQDPREHADTRQATFCPTGEVSSHNLNSQNFKLRVSNPRATSKYHCLFSFQNTLQRFKSPRVWAHSSSLILFETGRSTAVL